MQGTGSRLFSLKIRALLVLSFSIILGGFFALQVHAATVTWDGGGADNNWSTPENWSSDAVPTSSDVATFDGTSTKDATIDASFAGSVLGIDINSGYTGTITQARSLIVGSSGFDQADGTFTGGSSAIDIELAFTLSSGTFTSTSGTLSVGGNFTISGGTFNHNSGTVTLDETSGAGFDVNTSETFYNLTIAKSTANSVGTGASDTFIVENDFNVNSYINGAFETFQVAGDVAVNGRCGIFELTFDGTGAQTLDQSGATTDCTNNITVNKASGTLTLLSDVNTQSGSDFILQSGTVDVDTYTLYVGVALEISGGTLNAVNGTLMWRT